MVAWPRSALQAVQALKWESDVEPMLRDLEQRFQSAMAPIPAPAPSITVAPPSSDDPGGAVFRSLDEQTSGWQEVPNDYRPGGRTTPSPASAFPSLDDLTAHWAPESPAATIADGRTTPQPQLAPGEPVSSVNITSGPRGTAASTGGSNPEKQARVYQQARASGLDDEGARILVAVTETEGGLEGAIGDQGKSRGPYQFHEGGQFPGFAAWLRQQGIQGDPYQLVNDVDLTTRYAAEGYLGRAIAAGRAAGLSGADLATYVQRHGQVSVNPEKTGENYQRMFGGAAQNAAGASSSVPAAAPPFPPAVAPAAGPTPAPSATPAGPAPAPIAPTSTQAPGAGPKLRVRDPWGNEFEMTQQQLDNFPGGRPKDYTVLGPVAQAQTSAPTMARMSLEQPADQPPVGNGWRSPIDDGAVRPPPPPGEEDEWVYNPANVYPPVDIRVPGEFPYDRQDREGADATGPTFDSRPYVPQPGEERPFDDRMAMSPGLVSDVSFGMGQPAPPARDDWRSEQPVPTYNDPTDGGTQAQPLPVPVEPRHVPEDAPTQPIPQPSIEIANGGEPSGNGDWQEVETRPRAAPAVADQQERYINQQVPSPPGWQAIVDGAGNVVDWVREFVGTASEAREPTPEERAQNASVAGMEPGQSLTGTTVTPVRTNTRPPVESTPGEADYVPPAPSPFDAGGILEPGGAYVSRVTERIRQIEDNAEREMTGRPRPAIGPARAVFDSEWRRRNPEVAAEYDALQQDLGLNIAGQVGDTARVLGRAGRMLAEAGLPGSVPRATEAPPFRVGGLPGELAPEVIPPHVADALDFPVRVPDDPSVIRAIEAVGGRVDPERGVDLYVTRAQSHAGAGTTAPRGMVFYEAIPEGGRSSYASGIDAESALGGSQVIPRSPTRFRSALILSDAPGEMRGFNQGMEQLGDRVDPRQIEAAAQEEQRLYQRLLEIDREYNDAVKAGRDTSALERENLAVDDAHAAARQRHLDLLDQSRPIVSADIDAGLREAQRAGPEGSPERIAAVKDMVARYGGDPDLIDTLMATRYQDVSERVWAIKENILAANARRQGYDGVVVVQRGGTPTQAEIDAHPKVAAIKEAYDAAVEAYHAAKAPFMGDMGKRPDEDMAAYWARAASFDPGKHSNALVRASRNPKVIAAQEAWEETSRVMTAAQREAMEDLAQRGRITELADVREARNPTPPEATPDLKAAAQRVRDATNRVRELEAQPFPESGSAVEVAARARSEAYSELKEAERILDDLLNTADTTPGYELRADVPRRGPVRESTIVENTSLEDAREAYERALQAAAGKPKSSPEVQALMQASDAFAAAQKQPRYRTAANATPGIAPDARPDMLAQVNADIGSALGSSTFGAAAGAALPAESEEERRANALRGAGLGLVGGPLASRAMRRGQGALATFGAAPQPGAPNRAVAIGADPSRRYEFRYRVVDLGDLIPSNLPNGAPNPKFPQELQPRARSRVASQRQIEQIARNLEPDALLTDVGRLDSGPMIVGADNIVESGNGRVLALQQAAARHPEQYEQYAAALRSSLGDYGLSDDALEGVSRPVLVRERVSDVDRAAFAQEANNAGLLRMSSVEQAAQDAANLSDDAVTALQVGENDTIASALRKTENRDLVRRWVGTLPENERAGVLDASGDLSAQGYERLTNAMLMRTYGEGAGERLARAFIESADPVVRNVQTALMASLPDMARAEALIRSGQRAGDLSIADDVATAAEMLARLRREGVKVPDYLGQAAMFERELTPLQESILAFLDRGQRKPSMIREVLKDYAARVENTADPNQVDMFGGQVAAPTREDLWRGSTTGSGIDVPDAPLLDAIEANPPAGRVPADGAGLEAAPEPAPAASPAPAARPAPQPVAPRPGPVPDIAPRGGPEGTLDVEGTPPRLTPPTEAPRGTLPAGGPEGTLAVEGAPRPMPRPGPIPEGMAPAGGPEGELVRPLALPTDPKDPLNVVARRVAKMVKGDQPEADRLVGEFKRLMDSGAGPREFADYWRGVEEHNKIKPGEVFALFRRFNMLSGPRTFEVNGLSGALNLGYEVVAQGGQQLARGRVAEAAAEVAAPFRAAGKAFGNLVETLRHGVTAEQALRGDIPQTLSSRAASPIGRGALTVMEVPDRLNAAFDQFYRTMTEEWAATTLAHRMARAKGIRPGNPTWAEKVAENLGAIRADPSKYPQIREMGDHVTFAEEPGGLVKWLEEGKRKYPNIIGFITPFVRTPANIASRAVDLSPLGVVRNAAEAATGLGRGRKNLSRRVRDNLIGVAATYWAYEQAKQGNITGAGPDDPEKRAMLRATGWQPFSVKIGDQYWSYANFAPFSLALSMGAAAHEVGQYAKEGETDALSLIADGAARTGKVVTDMTVLAGIGSIVKSIQDPDRYGTQWLTQSLTQLIPAGSLVNTVGQATDPYIRRAERDTFANQVTGGLMARVPGLRENVPIAQDPLGRPIPNEQTGLGALNPFRPTTERPDPAIRAFLDAGVDLGKPKERLTVTPGGVQIELTPAEQRRWNELRGELLAAHVPAVAADQRYQEADKLARGKGLQRMLAAASTAADNRLKAEIGSEELTRRLREAVAQKRAS